MRNAASGRVGGGCHACEMREIGDRMRAQADHAPGRPSHFSILLREGHQRAPAGTRAAPGWVMSHLNKQALGHFGGRWAPQTPNFTLQTPTPDWIQTTDSRCDMRLADSIYLVSDSVLRLVRREGT